MTERITTIQIKSDTWKSLTEQKNLGESMDDVIKRLLKNEQLISIVEEDTYKEFKQQEKTTLTPEIFEIEDKGETD
jgi:predicted CopG family antitoxin